MTDFEFVERKPRSAQQRADVADRFFTCDACGRSGFYPNKNYPSPPGGWRQGDAFTLKIVGRSDAGGYLCRDCAGSEVSWKSAAFEDFEQRHADDMWGALIRASRDVRSEDREQVAEFMGLLKAQAAKSGGLSRELPYDPKTIAPED